MKVPYTCKYSYIRANNGAGLRESGNKALQNGLANEELGAECNAVNRWRTSEGDESF